MTKGLLGRKVGMTQVYEESGIAVPVTVIAAGPCDVLQIRTSDRDGYEAVQLGFEDKPRRLSRRSERGHVAKLSSKRSKKLVAAGQEVAGKAGCEPKRFVRELRGSTEQKVRAFAFDHLTHKENVGGFGRMGRQRSRRNSGWDDFHLAVSEAVLQ